MWRVTRAFTMLRLVRCQTYVLQSVILTAMPVVLKLILIFIVCYSYEKASLLLSKLRSTV